MKKGACQFPKASLMLYPKINPIAVPATEAEMNKASHEVALSLGANFIIKRGAKTPKEASPIPLIALPNANIVKF